MRKSGPFLDIKIEGYRDVLGRFARATTEVTTARRDEMRTLGRRVMAALQDEAPVRTGRLKKGIRFNTRESGREVTVRVTSEAWYTDLVIHGRGPVVAIHAKALRFEPGPPGSGFIFRKRVGPSKPNPFHRRAFAKLGDEPRLAAARISRRIEAAFSKR